MKWYVVNECWVDERGNVDNVYYVEWYEDAPDEDLKSNPSVRIFNRTDDRSEAELMVDDMYMFDNWEWDDDDF